MANNNAPNVIHGSPLAINHPAVPGGSTRNMIAVWHWNCRGLRRKKTAFNNYVAEHSPAIIALQETNGEHKLTGYNYFTQPSIVGKRRGHLSPQPPCTQVIIYVRRDLAATQIDAASINDARKEHVCVRIRLQNTTLLLLAAYWLPKQDAEPLPDYATFLRTNIGDPNILIVGDFNAPHYQWGYDRHTSIGRKLCSFMQGQCFSLLNNTLEYTRRGNRTEQDTNPDLAWYKGHFSAEWHNTGQDGGSDHYICFVTFAARDDARRQSGRRTAIVDWDKVRNKLDAQPSPLTIQEWAENLRSTTHEFRKEVTCTEKYPFIDRHLLNLWDSRRKIVRRLRKNKANVHIQDELARCNENIQRYADDLARRNWQETCESINGHLHLSRVWQILKNLLGRATERHALANIQLTLQIGDDELHKAILDTFYPPTQPEELPSYTGLSSSGMDSDFTAAELSTALASMSRNTAPGADEITYAMLRNLSNDQQSILLGFFNDIWRSGVLPIEWKIATICVIPKPGKRPDSLTNLRPISLTSCVGKVMEKMILTRYEWHLDNHKLLPATLIGFRRHVSAQDAALLIKQDVYSQSSRVQTRTLVGLDIHKAFDNIKHAALLEKVYDTQPGRCFADYIRSFLSDRQVQIAMTNSTTTNHALRRGTPQGAILSPTLFNVALKDLPTELNSIPGHIIYADDITLWCTTGNAGEQERNKHRCAVPR